jgi:hypothetical protein
MAVVEIKAISKRDLNMVRPQIPKNLFVGLGVKRPEQAFKLLGWV